MTDTMKAVRIHGYGDTSVLAYEDAPMPEINDNEVLVKIHAAGINPVDWKIREGYLQDMLPHRLPLTLGWDFAGEIVALGEQAKQWQKGQAVYSRPDIARNGTYAEYIAVKAEDIAAKPQSLDWQQAAGVPLAALTAWQALYDDAQIKTGDKVLIQAGSGGVGQFAIQLAKLRGATVYTTTSTKNVAVVRDLGADEVIDYTQDSYTRLKDLDVVLDTLGGKDQAQSWQCLREGGKLVSIVEPPEEAVADQYKAIGLFRFVQPDGKQLQEISALFDDKKLSVHIDKVFPLVQAKEAQLYSQSQRAVGKIILQVAK